MRRVCRFLSVVAFALAAALLLPIAWGLYDGGRGLGPLLLTLLLCAGVCIAMRAVGRGARFQEMRMKEALLAVPLSWLLASLLVGLPYRFDASVPTLLDAFFEGVSGFTTTGASVIPDLGRVPRSILLWRSFSQWIGGVGIVVLALAVLPASSAGMQLYRSEVAGPVHERLTPRIQQTAAFLWKTYVTLTTIQIALLLFGGLGLFDAMTLAFGTLATGGFSPYADNVGHFDSSYVKWVTAVFLFLAGANVTLFHAMLAKRSLSPLWKNPEFRFYAFLLLLFGVATSSLLYVGGVFASVRTASLEGFFTCVSMLSTCGYFISDYNAWPSSVRSLMLILMFCGGCATSSAGGITCLRVRIVLRHVGAEFRRLLHPRAVIPTRLGEEAVDSGVISSCFAFVIAYVALFLAGFGALALFGQDMTTAISGAAATLGNVGPGFGMIGPTESYAAQPGGVKVVYILLMLCGRLEIFPLLVVFTPSFWRR